MSDAENNTSDLRARALALLLTVQGQLSQVQDLQSTAPEGAVLRTQLDGASGSLSAVAGQLTQALSSQNFPLSATELMMLSRSIQSANVPGLAAATASSSSASAQELAAASAATRTTVQQLGDDLFTRHIFDDYLEFDSAEDKKAYREREAERQRYTAGQLARNTPQGNLNAAGAEAGQMLEAHAHGADRSPEWQSRWDELTVTIQQQRTKMIAAGQSTEEYDRNLREDVRRFLKTEAHLSDADIDARLATNADPLVAVKPYLSGSTGVRTLMIGLQRSELSKSDSVEFAKGETGPDNAPPPAPAPGSLDAIAATFQATGTKTDTPAEAAGHGLPPIMGSPTGAERTAPSPS